MAATSFPYPCAGTHSSPTALVTHQTTVSGIAMDVTAGRLYWADWLGTALRSANLADEGGT
ncbi:hypothetical protein D7X12_01445 [Corallococcus sicarius]|uniref:Uncharacterized protein n=1 Tax=Corallococcus sicarius TaxID=2316726 RepID=A0A3A8P3E8_9BACT|nr:hypothetical protein D7X12_01445 [Corallococcus sicarius]